MKSSIRNVFFAIFISIILYSCVSYIPITIDSTLKESHKIKIAILSTNVYGNPDIKKDNLLSDVYSFELKKIGFDVIDRVFVDSWLRDNNIDLDSEITTSTMKMMQIDLNADAILSTNATYVYVPEKQTSSTPKSDTNIEVNVNNNYGNSRISSKSKINTSNYGNYNYYKGNNQNSKSSKTGAYYKKNIESLKLIDAINSKILIEAVIERGNLKPSLLTDKILKSIKFNLETTSKSK